jgi:hypothetical protein
METTKDKVLTTTKETQEIQEAKPKEVFYNEFDLGTMLSTAGSVKLNEKQKKILYEEVNPDDVAIRLDGLIYLPWVHYVKMLHEAFGMEWALITQGSPTIRDNNVVWGFHLIVKGSLMGYVIGEQEYFPNNRRMSYTDACEAAKSNALMRLCKQIGVGLELWDPQFIDKWKKQYAETYVDRGKKLWKKKSSQAGTDHQQIPDDSPRLNELKAKILEIINNEDFKGMVDFEGKEEDLDFRRIQILENIDRYTIQRMEEVLRRVARMLWRAQEVNKETQPEVVENELSDGELFQGEPERDGNLTR